MTPLNKCVTFLQHLQHPQSPVGHFDKKKERLGAQKEKQTERGILRQLRLLQGIRLGDDGAEPILRRKQIKMILLFLSIPVA